MTGTGKELVSVEVRILNETDAAWLITPGAKHKANWVPKSQVKFEDRHEIKDFHVMQVPEWLAQRAGLI